MADPAAFLARYAPQAEGAAVWGRDPLRLTAYLGREQPPLAYVTSVRSLVFRQDAVLVLRNRDGTHILPGGRRKAAETLEETLRREVLEETGWTLRAPTMLGFLHFHHRGPKPPDHPYQYPDFVQVVYMAEVADYVPEARLPDDYETDAALRPIADALALALTPAERLYLETALQERGAR